MRRPLKAQPRRGSWVFPYRTGAESATPVSSSRISLAARRRRATAECRQARLFRALQPNNLSQTLPSTVPSCPAARRSSPPSPGAPRARGATDYMRVFVNVYLWCSPRAWGYPFALRGGPQTSLSSFSAGDGAATVGATSTCGACARFQATRQRAPQNLASFRVARASAPHCWHLNSNQYQRCRIAPMLALLTLNP